ncbi:MAG: sn-glycerol-3-phosphate ABC transporter ATP-binding protein UgpC [Devosia sp.]
MGSISLRNVGKTYGGTTVAVTDVNLEIENGEFVVFVGPSGCGKSTLLRMIAGLEPITAGEIAINGQVVNDKHARDRDIAMVFQNYALYPQMSVRENIAFALELRKMPRDEVRQRVDEAARILDLGELLDRKPGQLSGGQRQRVAMGRAIVRQPQAFLLDEPLSNLDAKLRVQLRGALGRLHSRLNTTTIHVTHDQVEAMTLGSRVAVFSRGRLQQYDTPHALYHAPANIFVAGFIGSPAMNFFQATVTGAGAQVELAIGSARVQVTPRSASNQLKTGDKVVLGIRPEHLSIVPAGGASLGGRVELVERLEPESYVGVVPTDAGVGIRFADDYSKGAAEEAETVRTDERMLMLRVSADRLPALKESLHIMVDGSRALLFDIATGAAI